MEKFCDLENVDRGDMWNLVSPDLSELISHLSHVRMKDLTLPMAIEVLEIFRDTGKVEWLQIVSKTLV